MLVLCLYSMIDEQKLNKYFAGDATQQEKEEVQLWLEADDNNKNDYLNLRRLNDIAIAHCPEMKTAKSGKRLWLREFLKIAAAIFITLGCAYTYHIFTTEHNGGKDEVVEDVIAMQTINVPAGQRVEVVLADGTVVWLNAFTSMSFPDRFAENTRDVYLNGEAYFNVSPDAERKFIVHTDRHNINVLGTEFNVKAYKKDNLFETSLLKGSLEVISNDRLSNVMLIPGDRVYLKDGMLVKDAISHYDYFLWKKGIISFEHERIKDILLKLQLYYDINIVNKNQSINEMRYTGKFQTKDGIEHVLNVLKIPTGLRYTKNSESNMIQIY